MADTTKQLTDQSLFVYVRDTNNNKIKKIVIPSDVQVGLLDNPTELLLTGRLSVSTKDYTTTGENKGIISLSNNDTIVAINLDVVPLSTRITVNLPSTPRNGQLHFIKDQTGTADTVPIDIVSPTGIFIDQYTYRTLSDKYGSLALYWSGGRWHILVSGVGLSTTGGAPNDATYVTLNGNSLLSNERRLDLTGSNIVMTDNGANSSVTLDLSSIRGVSGTYTNSTVSIDDFGRVTAASNGTPSAPSDASYLVLSNDATLTNERALAIGNGILGQDIGPDSVYIISVDDNVVATISGSTFIGDISAPGISGSLQNISSGESYLVAGSNVTIVTQSNGQIVISSAPGFFSGTISFGGDPYASYLTLSTTASLYNERVLTVSGTSGLILNDAGSNGNATLGINNNIVATISGSTFTGNVIAQTGLSGSLQQTSNGLSYIVAGDNVTVVSSSNGQIVISSTAIGSSGDGDPNATYLVLSTTGSLTNERVLTVSGSSGLLLNDNSGSATLEINNNIVATISGSTFTGPVNALAGFTGSLFTTNQGLSYLVAGNNVTIVSSSNGQIVISSTVPISGDSDATYLVLSATSSLSNERVLTVPETSGLMLVDAGSGGNATLGINDNIIATISGSTFTGNIIAQSGLSGSLQNISSGESYLVAGSNVTIVTQSNGQIVISSTAIGSSGDGDPNATYLVLSTTSSLSNERVLTISGTSGLLLTDAGAGGGATLEIDDNFVATISGSTFTGPVNALAGFTGSIFTTTQGLSYLVAGDNVTVVSQSNGQIVISSTALGGSGDGDPNASYLVLSTTSSLSNERVLVVSGSSGLLLNDSGPSSNVSLLINDNIVATVSGTNFIGPVIAQGGLSGSLLQTSAGLSYLVAGENITINSSSNGQILISAIQSPAIGGSGDPDASYVVLSTTASLSNERVLSGGTGISITDNGPGGTVVISSTITSSDNLKWIDGNNKLKTTSSVAVSGVSDVYCDAIGQDVHFYISGTISSTSSSAKIAAFGGDVVVTGSVKVGTGSLLINSNAVIWGEEQTRIERHGNDLKFFDNNNSTGYSLTELAIQGTGGGSGDPDASYIVLSTTSSLSNERILSAGTGISIIDNGPNNTVVISATGGSGGSSFPRSESLTIIAGNQSVYTTVFEDIGAFEFNTSGVDSMIPSGSTSYTAYFQPIVEVYPYGMTTEVRLFNISSNSEVSNSILSSSSVIPERLKSVDLSTNLAPTGSNIYTIQLRLLSTTIDARAVCKGAKLYVTWS